MSAKALQRTMAVCRVLPVPASAAGVLRYCYRQRKGDSARDRAGVLAVAGHSEGGVLFGDARLDAEVLKSRCPPGKNAVKHVLISPEKNDPDVVKRLLRAGQHWCQRFAPGRSFVLIVHNPDKDSPHIHLHIVVENYNNEKAIHGGKAAALDMVGMRFTDAFAAVREDGSPSPSRGASKVYPHAPDLKAQEVVQLLDGGETWDSLKAKGVVADAPLRKGYKVANCFIYQGKRIRFATAERLRHSRQHGAEVSTTPTLLPIPQVKAQQKVATPKKKIEVEEVDVEFAINELYLRLRREQTVPPPEVDADEAIERLYAGAGPSMLPSEPKKEKVQMKAATPRPVPVAFSSASAAERENGDDAIIERLHNDREIEAPPPTRQDTKARK